MLAAVTVTESISRLGMQGARQKLDYEHYGRGTVVVVSSEPLAVLNHQQLAWHSELRVNTNVDFGWRPLVEVGCGLSMVPTA